MSKLGLLSKNYCKLLIRPTFINGSGRTSNFNPSRRHSRNSPSIHNFNFTVKDEHENEIKDTFYYNQELDILKKQNLDDLVKIVEKFQKAKLADLQKVLTLAQRLQANQQKSEDHQSNLVFNLKDLNKVHLTRVDQTPALLDPKLPGINNSIDANLATDESKELSQLGTVTKIDKKNKNKKRKSIALDIMKNLQKNDVLDLNSVNSIKQEYKNIRKDLLEFAKDQEDKIKSNVEKLKELNNIRAHLQLCISNDMLNDAHNNLTNLYLNEMSKMTHPDKYIVNIRMYVDLMNAYAKKGNLECMRKLYSQIMDLKIQPTYGVFAAMFECLGRSNSLNTKLVKFYISEIEKHNLQIENIFSERIYTPLEQKFVLKTISPLLPNITVKPRTLNHNYDCPMKNHLKKSMKMTNNPLTNFLNKDTIKSKLKQQIETELMDEVTVKSVIPEPLQLQPEVQRAREQLDLHREQWRKALLKSFNAVTTNMQHNNNLNNSKTSLLPFLRLWKPEVYVEFMMQEIEHIAQDLSGYCPPTHRLQYVLGEKIFKKLHVQTRYKKLGKILPLFNKYTEKISDTNLSCNHRTLWNDLALEKSYQPVSLQPWSYELSKETGKILYNILMSSIRVWKPSTTEDVSDELHNSSLETSNAWEKAFFTKRVSKDTKFFDEVESHPWLSKLYMKAELTDIKFSPIFIPMVVPPIPWTDHDQGGCLLNSVDLVRNPGNCVEQIELIRSLPNQKLYSVYDGLNALGACPWRVNTWVLDHVIKKFIEGGDEKLNIPKRYTDLKKVPIYESMTPEELQIAMIHNKEVVKNQNELYGIWASEHYRLSIANTFRNDVFWFSHTVDFRGRTYPTQPHFNHFGTDLARSILEFGKGKPLGPKGLDWLKVHLINLTGFMKRNSNDEKLAHANEIMHLIEDSVDKPFDGEKWWQTSDKPWESLTCCKEIVDAIRSPDPEQFISHLPIHQDGSCNGLQHYAALGRDSKGAKSVNLGFSATPQDVYSDVMDIIEKMRRRDAAAGNAVAKSLEGYLKRKIVKQPIMTYVYGVTYYGALNQIRDQLKAAEYPKDITKAANYITYNIFGILETLFLAAKNIKIWFNLCAYMISKSKHEKVSWVTPLGWPVIQPYRISKGKQITAFAPNFVHSLDASHMLLTAIHCYNSGLLFASIHDCFWTHASDIDEMNKICREQFVELHKHPILEDLSKHYKEHFLFTNSENSNLNEDQQELVKQLYKIYEDLPKKGDFNIEEVKDSTYFFS